jgi:4-amino-4-deoxy-L-arabinose transferase-like glycosyltransferase
MLKIISIPAINHSLKALLLVSLVGIPLFIHLEKLPIRIWDESRLAINAYEMYQSGNLLVTTFDGKPDMWNTKPPLMIWLQVLSMKIFGVRELSLRLPAALAGLFTVLFLFMFLKKRYAGFWPGFIASIILVTSYGYVNVHVTRTGDYDSLLVFCLTGCAFSFYNYFESGSLKQLRLSGLFLWMGIMTKGIQGLLFMPGLAF